MDIAKFSDKNICDYLASNIRIERRKAGYTQAKFAELTGISLRTYKRFEANGQGNIETLIQILRALGKLRILQAMFPVPAEVRLTPEEKVAQIAVRVLTNKNT